MREVSLRELLQELAEERKFDLRGYKLTSVERRFRHRMFQLKITDYSSYSDYIRRNPAEINDLLNTVLINTTQFFRDPQGWELLRTEILPKLTATLKPGDSFRAWSAGCASGEEPYSLAILLREHFGQQARDYDLKVYATDVDEDALDVARRGDYSTDKLRYVPRHWRENYFYPADKTARVGRDIRRMVIFGCSNLAIDAPISHLHLLLCRNVLIYFDSPLQRQTLTRLHFALEPAGVLMLGKSESQLIGNTLFSVLNPKWRIFQRREVDNRERARELRFVAPRQVDPVAKAPRQDDSLIKLCHNALLQTLEPSVILVDPGGVVISENQASRRLWGRGNESIVGKPLKDTPIAERCPELLERLEAVRKPPHEPSRFEFSITGDEGERDVALTVKPVNEQDGKHVATLIYAEDITPRKKLQHTIHELQATGQELQATNRELETTNEELQATNEELETTSEELQSTNEELETTNEELQALNEELGTTNEELEVRSKEVDELNARYSETLERMPWPLLLVSENGKVQFWNTAATRMFGLEAKSIIGLQLSQVPVSEKLRSLLTRNHRDVLARGRGKAVRDFEIEMNSFTGSVDMQFVPLPDERSRSVIIALQVTPGNGGGRALSGGRSNRAQSKRNANPRKNKSSKKKSKRKR
jgi:two-component system, chemotaxis family, CheB/CheR fusion protein